MCRCYTVVVRRETRVPETFCEFYFLAGKSTGKFGRGRIHRFLWFRRLTIGGARRGVILKWSDMFTHLASYSFCIAYLNYSAIDFCVFVYLSVFYFLLELFY